MRTLHRSALVLRGPRGARLLVLAGGLALGHAAASAGFATAEPQGDAELFAEGKRALDAGNVRQAIDLYETLADRGFAHPDASFNRGLAYLARVRAHDEKPGDLGRAAAAFEECLWKRAGDEDAERALETVRNEVARRLPVESGKGPLTDQGPSPRDAIAGLLPETTWATLALASSVLLSLALFARWRVVGRARPTLIASSTAILALAVLLVATPFAAISRSLRRSTSSAVVVSREARWVKEDGTVLPGAAVPEAARVQVMERRGSLLRVRWGKTEGLVRPIDLRIVRPQDAS